MSFIPSYKKPGSGGEYVPPTWSDGSDEEIVTALEKHYAGEIDLTEYWSVGDERTVHINAITDTSYGNVSLDAQDITLVLLNTGGKTLATPINEITECAFIVGIKTSLLSDSNDTLNYASKINGKSVSSTYSPDKVMTNKIINWGSTYKTSDTNYGDYRFIYYFLNYTFMNALPDTIVSIFKQCINESGCCQSSSYLGTCTSNEYFALPNEFEVSGEHTISGIETNSIQFNYYETSANRPSTRLRTIYCQRSSSRYWLYVMYNNSSGINPQGDMLYQISGSAWYRTVSTVELGNIIFFGCV